MKRQMIFLCAVITTIWLLSVLTTPSAAKDLKYDRNKAIAYAEKWCNEKNTQQYTDHGGSDCANFASQTLIAGFGGLDEDGNIVGNPFGCVKGADILGKDGKTKGVSIARGLGPALSSSFCFRIVNLSEAKDGDVVTWQDSSYKSDENPTGTYHSGILNKDKHVATHSNPHCSQGQAALC